MKTPETDADAILKRAEAELAAAMRARQKDAPVRKSGDFVFKRRILILALVVGLLVLLHFLLPMPN